MGKKKPQPAVGWLLITHLSKSLSLEESRKPLANGLLSIFSFVIYQFEKKKRRAHMSGFVLFDFGNIPSILSLVQSIH
jgi:hypothetical protein